MRRLAPALLVALALVVAAPAAVGAPGDRKQQVDEKLSTLRDRIDEARAREQQLNEEIDTATAEIRELEVQLGEVSARLGPLEENLALHQERLDKLNELFRLQTEQLQFLRSQYRLATDRLANRIVEIYELGRADTLDVIVSAVSFSEVVDQVEFTNRIKEQDETIARQVRDTRDEVRATRARTRRTRVRVAAITRAIEIRTQEVRALRDQLVARESELSSARERNQQEASELDETVEEMMAEAAALEEVSAELAAKIQDAQSSSSVPTTRSSSSGGLIWPVNGPVTSTYGYRCLAGLCRVHEGIDIGVGYGTAIHASASGTVIYAGYEGGYGNLIVVDHGGGLATAYAHQSSFAVGGGAQVSQGQVIGYVGCTGRCFGPHLHFEVRVNGGAVDPLGYL